MAWNHPHVMYYAHASLLRHPAELPRDCRFFINANEPMPSRMPSVLVAGPAAATAAARASLRESPFLTGYQIVACETAATAATVAERADIAAVLIVATGDGARLPELIAAIHRRQRNPLMALVVRSRKRLSAAVRNRLWDLGVADQQFEQALDGPALGGSLAVALRDHARQQMHCAVAEAAAVLANADTLGEQASIALRILVEQGFGRRGALFCFQRNSSGRHLLAISGSGLFAGVDCTPIGDIADARAAELVQQAWNCGASLFGDDLAVLYVGTRIEAHPALIVLALDAALLPWQQRVLEVYANAIAPAIEDRQQAQQLARTQHAMISTLASLAEYKDADTGEHVSRVARTTAAIASHLARAGDCPAAGDLVAHIGHASILHDLGKVAIPEAVLLKPGALSAEERRMMNLHAVIGHEMLREAAALAAHGEAKLFHLASEIARSHHERYDGKGYPDGLSGEAIPLAARIVAVVDVFDALISRRPYKEPWSAERALELIRAESGHHFDPRVVDALLAVHERKAQARFIEWSDDMSVGYEELDRDHQRLIGILNNLGVNLELGDRNVVGFILDDLADYALVHFRREEQHLEQLGFAGLARHRAIHAGIARRIEDAKWKHFQGFSVSLESELLAFLTTWLNNHILVEDMQYHPQRDVASDPSRPQRPDPHQFPEYRSQL